MSKTDSWEAQMEDTQERIDALKTKFKSLIKNYNAVGFELQNISEDLNKLEKRLEKFGTPDNTPVGFENDIIFLLSTEEYFKYKNQIPKIDTWWWLRSDGSHDYSVSYVRGDGTVDQVGKHFMENGTVRPALKYKTLTSSIIETSEPNTFIWNDVLWKVIDPNKKIAILGENEMIKYLHVARFANSGVGNQYENSFIRHALMMWANHKSLLNDFVLSQRTDNFNR